MKRRTLVVALVVVTVASFLAGAYSSEILRPGRRADFKVENLKVSSSSPYGEIYSMTPVAISVDVSNSGNLSEVTRVSVKVDNETVVDNILPLVVGEGRTIETEIKAGEKVHKVGTHTVKVGNLTETYEVKKFPVEISVGGFASPKGVLCRCASGESARPNSPLLEISVTNKGSENMTPFRVVIETPEGEYSRGGVTAQSENACSSACARSNLRGETRYYVPMSGFPASPRPGEYKMKVADYSLQGVWEGKTSYSGSSPEVTLWGPIQFKRKEDGFAPSRSEVTVRNEGDLPLSVAGLIVSMGGENLRGTVTKEPFVLPGRERTFQIEFENHERLPGGTHTAEFKLLEWTMREGSSGVTVAAEETREVEVE